MAVENATPETDLPAGLIFVEEPPTPEHFNVVLYGPTGGGKSTGAASAPGPILWVNADGPNALAYARKTARERGTTILEVRITPDPRADTRQILRDVVTHVRGGGVPEVETVVVDTIGKVREALIAQLVQPGAKNSLQQFGDVAKALGGFVRTMRDLPVNLLLLAHEDIADTDGDRIVRPLIGGALTETIPGEVDIVAYCAAHREENEIQYLGQLAAGRGRRAKDRSGGLGVVRPLDISEWLEAFRAALGGDVPWARPESDADAEADESVPVDDGQQELAA